MSVTVLFTTNPHPLTGKPINSIVAMDSNDRDHFFILDFTKPSGNLLGQWEKVERFPASAPVLSLSFKNGFGHTLLEAAKSLDHVNNVAEFRDGKPFAQFQTHSYTKLQTYTKNFDEWVNNGQIPPLPATFKASE